MSSAPSRGWAYAAARTRTGVLAAVLAGALACGPGEEAGSSGPRRTSADVDPETAEVLVSLQRHLELRKFDEGVAEGEAFLVDHPDVPGLHYAIGVLHLGKQNYQAAVEYLTEATTRDPGHVDGHLQLGTAHTRLGALDAGNASLRRALELDPSASEAAFLLGKNLSRQGVNDEAQEWLERAAAGRPADSLYELGLLHQKVGKPAAAEEAFRAALAADPEHLAATYNLAQALIVAGRREEGELLMRRHSDLRQKHHELDQLRKTTLYEWAEAENFAQLAAHYLLNGDHQRAEENFRKALRLDPGDPGATLGLGRTLLDRGRVEEAAAEFEKVVASAPEIHHGHFFLGICRHLTGDFEGARSALAASREHGEWGEQEYLFFGNALLQTGALEDARIAYREAVALVDGPSETLRKLGLANYLLGDLQGAAEAWSTLASARPDDAELWMLLGIAQYRLSGASASEPAFRRAIERQRITLHGEAQLDSLLAGLATLPGSEAAIAHYRTLRAG